VFGIFARKQFVRTFGKSSSIGRLNDNKQLRGFTMYSSLTVSYYLIGKAKDENAILTALKLQKILYLAYGHYAAATSGKLFSESIVAWQYGPVVQSIYQTFKRFGNENLCSFVDNSTEITTQKIEDAKEEISIEHQMFLDMIWSIYKRFTAGQLVELTHRDQTPWAQVTHNGSQIGNNKEIEFVMIQEHFSHKATAYAL
jgi:uncharacterized phage-associated protein